MDDLISRAAAIAQIKENYCHWCDHIDLCQSCETQDCIATIEQQVPAVDAVPVVRCKDCICYDDEPGGTLKMCYCGLGWTSPDDYCSKGARAKKMDGESDG